MIPDNVKHTNARIKFISNEQRIKRLKDTIKSMEKNPTFVRSNYLLQLKKQLNDLINTPTS